MARGVLGVSSGRSPSTNRPEKWHIRTTTSGGLIYISIEQSPICSNTLMDDPDVPNNTNSLESFFEHLKDNLRIHRGLSREHQKNFIKWYLHFADEKKKKKGWNGLADESKVVGSSVLLPTTFVTVTNHLCPHYLFLCQLCVRAAAWAAGCLESAVKPLCQIFFFVGIKYGRLKSKDTFLRVAVPSYSVPIGQKKGRWEHQPKGNRLIINHKIKSDVAIRRKNVWWPRFGKNTVNIDTYF